MPYDLILMDCQMPEMDGYAATAAIRRRERARGAPRWRRRVRRHGALGTVPSTWLGKVARRSGAKVARHFARAHAHAFLRGSVRDFWLLHSCPTPPTLNYALPQFDALRYVQERAPDVPVTVVTGALSDEAAAACLQQGAADYLLKDRLGRQGAAVRQALAARDLRVQHRQAHEALQVSEARLRALSEQASDLVGILDAAGTYRYASPSHRRIQVPAAVPLR